MKFVNFIIKDEMAQDLDGVKQEIFSVFWDEITNQDFEGGKSELVQKVNRGINKFREGMQDMDTQIHANLQKEDVLQFYHELYPTVLDEA